MINWKFYINDIEVEQPEGFRDIIIKISRDEQWHGIFFEAATSTLNFYGLGAELLIAEKEKNGLAASATLRIEADCGGTIDLLEGSLDFGAYIKSCGSTCLVSIAVEKTGCIMQMRNRYDQKVDLEDTKSFNKMTLLPNYNGLNFEMTIPAQEIRIGNEAINETQVSEDLKNHPNFNPDSFDDFLGYLTPAFQIIKNSSFGVFNSSPFLDLTDDGFNNLPPYPDFPTTTGTAQLLGNIVCALSNAELSYRLKGNVNANYTGTPALVIMRLKVFRLPVGLDGSVAANWIEESENEFYNGTGSQDFDITANIPLTINQGDFIYFGIFIIANNISDLGSLVFTQDVETSFSLTSASVCEESESTVSLIHETGSRIVEAITDGCIRMKSDYYGRTDSEPFASDTDGCGSLRILTSGLRLRNAENPKHFISLRDYFLGLRAIDNIGMGIETDPIVPTREVLRIEPTEYFYKDQQLLRFDAIPNARFILDYKYGFSLIKIGYTKWEVENVNGLDEFNSTKEFRTSLSTIDNTLDIQSQFVAGGYPIEITRQQSFADSGGADTKFDNDNFIICVEREAYGFKVEQGNIENASNFYSPATAYNWRIRPFYNLMRWWKSIAQTYVNLFDSASKLFFSAGTGNLTASGELLTYDPCKLENSNYSENSDIDKNSFIFQNLPIWKPERVTFTYPLSVADYNKLKANPYGYILLQCGNGEYVKAFIIDIQYRLSQGSADFNMLLKWD